MADQTISEALGLSKGFFEKAEAIVKKKLEDHDTVSAALEEISESIRDEAFGETNLRVSEYEKKLILSGFIAGAVISHSKIEQKMEELKMMMTLHSMAQKIGEDKGGNPIMGGVLDPSQLPPEVLKMILERIAKQREEGQDED